MGGCPGLGGPCPHPTHAAKLFSCYRCDSTEQLKALLPRLEQELKDTVKFKDLYQFTFSFAKSPGQKGLGESKPQVCETF